LLPDVLICQFGNRLFFIIGERRRRQHFKQVIENIQSLGCLNNMATCSIPQVTDGIKY
jgi:hypothetical protein